jgi:hypothetical protein
MNTFIIDEEFVTEFIDEDSTEDEVDDDSFFNLKL